MNFFAWRYARFNSVALDAADVKHFKRFHKHGFDISHDSCKYVIPVLKAILGSGEATKESREEVAKECEKVTSEYTNPDGTKKTGWMKTPNGKTTSLPEFLWLLIRTKGFKKLFGDWENVLLAQKILTEKEITALGLLLQMSGKEQRVAAKELYEAVRRMKPITAPDGRKIRFSSTGFKEAKHHSADPHTLALMEILPDVISSMHYFGEGDVEENEPHIKAYHLYARKVNLGDGEMVARIVVREDALGNFFYDEESTDFYFVKLIYEKETGGQTTREPNTGNDRQSPFAAHSLPEFFSEVKRGLENLERFGSENGEPTVSAIEQFLNYNKKD